MATNKNDDKKEPKKFKLISSSRRLTLTYVVFFVWVGLAILGMILKTNLTELAVYFTSGLPVILGYLWAETSRPSNEAGGGLAPNGQDIANIIASMKTVQGSQPQQNQTQQAPQYQAPQYQAPQYQAPQTQKQNPTYGQPATAVSNTQTDMIIYTDDLLTQLKISSIQLTTLQTNGYVKFTNGRYVFPKNNLDTIKSLLGIDGSSAEPTI